VGFLDIAVCKRDVSSLFDTLGMYNIYIFRNDGVWVELGVR